MSRAEEIFAATRAPSSEMPARICRRSTSSSTDVDVQAAFVADGDVAGR